MRILLTFIVTLLAFSCSSPGQQKELKYRRFTAINQGCSDNSAAWIASMTVLLVNPDEFIGQCIKVYGYFESGLNLHLFLTKEHAHISDYASSIRLADQTKNGELITSSCNEHYVSVIGKLDKTRQEKELVIRDINIIRKYHGDNLSEFDTCYDSKDVELLK